MDLLVLIYCKILGFCIVLSQLSSLTSCQCENGWTPVGDYCYKIKTVNISSSWRDAWIECDQIYGNLPSFQTESEWVNFQQWFNPNATTTPNVRVAIGYQMHNYAKSNSYIDINFGSAINWTIPWATGEPSETGWVCIVSTVGSIWQWKTVECNEEHLFTFVCQQGQINAPKSLCAPLYQAKSINGHIFTQDYSWCKEEHAFIENTNMGYVMPMHYPGVTEKVAIVQNSGTRAYIIVYGTADLAKVTYNKIVRSFYVLTYKPDSPSTEFAIIWKSNGNTQSDALLTKHNVGEYTKKTYWQLRHTAYLFDNQTSDQKCSLAKSCEWNKWTPWSSCTVPCGGGGVQTRTRNKSFLERNGGKCDNIFNDTQLCTTMPPCPRELNAVTISKAIVSLVSNFSINGILSFQQTDIVVRITGYIKGLQPGFHGIHIHTSGDLSKGCSSVGSHFDHKHENHENPQGLPRHIGDLGNVFTDSFGVTNVNITNSEITLNSGSNSVIGRAIVIHEKADDLGWGDTSNSKQTGNSGEAIACGIIGIVE